MHTEPRAARLFLLASRSPRPGDRCRYLAQDDSFDTSTYVDGMAGRQLDW